MLQLWREGPTDKVIGFLRVQQVPDVPLSDSTLGSSQSWLCGQTLGSLLSAELIATEKSVQEAGQATWTMTFPELTPFYIGQAIALWQDAVAIAGRLMNVNPYDQPGVELGKQLTRDALRRDVRL
jgi:glucose-6-phosphate isomerase